MKHRVVCAGLALLALATVACTDYVGDDLRAGNFPDDATVRFEAAVSATTTPRTDPTPTDPASLDAGACFDDPPDSTLVAFSIGRAVGVVPCNQPHRYEVFAVIHIAHTPDEEWPGGAVVDERADLACLAAFPEFVGSAWAESSLDYLHQPPTQRAWTAGHRDARCAVFDLGLGELQGTVADSGR